MRASLVLFGCSKGERKCNAVGTTERKDWGEGFINLVPAIKVHDKINFQNMC